MSKQTDDELLYRVFYHSRSDQGPIVQSDHCNCVHLSDKEFRLALIDDYNRSGKRVVKIETWPLCG